MAIKKEKFFEIINEISNDEDLNEDSLLEKIKQQLLKRKYEEEHNKFHLDLNKNHQFSIGILSKKEDWMLLHIAAACNNLLIVELLLKKKVSINARVKDGSNDGLTALHIAALYGHKDVIELLLSDNRIDPSLKSRNKTAKDMIDNVQDRDTIIEILEVAEESYRTSPKKKAKDLSIRITGGHYHLLQDSHGIMAKTVKRNGASTNVMINSYLEQQDTIQQSSLADEGVENEQCSRVSVKNMVEEFESLRKGSTIMKQPQEPVADQEHLHEQHYGKQISLDLTTDESSNNDSGVGTPSEEEVSLKDINAQDENALHRAAAEGHIEVVQHLIKGGVNINLQDENGYTPLHRAVAESHIEVVQHLIEGGANIDMQDKNGRASLHYAVMYKNKELVKLLIKCRANVEAVDKDGLTPVHYAAAGNCLEIGSYLIKNQANVNAQDRVKHTPLYYAVANDNKKLAKYLIKHGADRSLIKDEDLIGRLDSYADSHSQRNDVKKPRVKLKKSCAQFESKQKEIELLKQQVQELKNRNAEHKVSLEKAQQELKELNSHKLNEENESLKQKMKELKNENTILREKAKNQHSEAHLEKAQKELAELNHYVDEHETRLRKLDEENESLRQKVKELRNENTTLSSKLSKTKANKVPLEKAKLCFLKFASVNLVTMLTVSTIFSIAFQLSVPLMIATSVVSALIASGITYAISKPATELKEADISKATGKDVLEVIS